MLDAESKAPIPVAGDTPKQEVLDQDEFHLVVQSIDAANKTTALDRMHELILAQGLNYLEQGGLLKTMKDNSWFYGHKSFKSLCMDEFGFHHVKGLWLIRIFEMVVDAKLTWVDIENVGWTKMRVICSKGETEDHPKMIDKAKSMTVLQLEAALTDELSDDAKNSNKLKMVGFYPDQYETIKAAFEKVKQKDGVEAVSEAITLIATEYVGTPNMSVPKEVISEPAEKPAGNTDHEFTAMVKKAGPESTVKVLMKVFPTWTFQVDPPE